MNANAFTIFSTWAPRPDSPEKLGQRMLTNLDALTGLNPHFEKWWLTGERGGPIEDRLENYVPDPMLPLEDVRHRMTEVVEYGVRRDDFWKPEPAGGYWINAFNCELSPPSQEDAIMSAHGGGVVNPRAGLRVAKFETSSFVDPDPEIVSYPVFKAVLMSIASAWDVGHAQAYSVDLSKFWRKPHKVSLDLAWMTYLSPKLARKVMPPGDVLVERMDDGGLLMIAAEETFDAANAKHMVAARSILASLADLNAEMKAEAERLWRKW